MTAQDTLTCLYCFIITIELTINVLNQITYLKGQVCSIWGCPLVTCDSHTHSDTAKLHILYNDTPHIK